MTALFGQFRIITRMRIDELWIQPALRAQVFNEFFPVGGGQGLIELAALDHLGKQFRRVARHVREDFADPKLWVTRAHDVSAFIEIRENREGNTQLATITQGRGVMMRDAHGARVEELPLIKSANLAGIAELRFRSAAANRPIASARTGTRLKNRTVVAEFAEFVSGAQPGDASSEDDHAVIFIGRSATGNRQVKAIFTGE